MVLWRSAIRRSGTSRLARASVILQSRNISLIKRLLVLDDSSANESAEVLYNWDESPYEDLRMRAAYIRTKALCPVTHKNVNYVCPYSGIPTHHSREAWESDKEYHQNKVYEKLKRVNLYEHDLRSGRRFDEFDFPETEMHEAIVNFSNWDSFFYTRDFNPMNTEFNLAAATKVLTYPITIGSVLNKWSPYATEPKGPIKIEGLRSLSALHYSLYPKYNKEKSSFKDRALRIFIVGAKMEAMLPGYVWKQLGYLFPENKLEIHFVGPQCIFDPETKSYVAKSQNGRPVSERYDEQISLHYHTLFFNELYNYGDIFPFDPYLDVFFLFHPGFQSVDQGHWEKSLKGLLESKCAVFVTGYHHEDTQREMAWLMNHPLADEMDLLMNQTKNIFRSTKLDLVDTKPTEVFQANDEIFAFRGKRYHAIKK